MKLSNVQLSDGMIAEVQVNVHQMLEAKGLEHKIYEIKRKLEIEVNKKRLTEEQVKINSIYLDGISHTVYDSAYQAVLEESQFNAASLDNTWLARSSVSAQENWDGESDLSSFTKKYLQNLGLSANSLTESPASIVKNSNEGSSKSGTLGDGGTKSAMSPLKKVSDTSGTSTSSIAQKKRICQYPIGKAGRLRRLLEGCTKGLLKRN